MRQYDPDYRFAVHNWNNILHVEGFYFPNSGLMSRSMELTFYREFDEARGRGVLVLEDAGTTYKFASDGEAIQYAMEAIADSFDSER